MAFFQKVVRFATKVIEVSLYSEFVEYGHRIKSGLLLFIVLPEHGLGRTQCA